MKRRVKRLAYELDLSTRWKIYSIIFVTQLKSASKDSYRRARSNHSDFVFVEKDISIEKFYEIEQVLIKRTRQYAITKINQYLIKWKNYESKFDEWRSIFDLINCIDLMKNFEQQKETRSRKQTRSRKNRVNNSRHQ
jgi:hypothetical protein